MLTLNEKMESMKRLLTRAIKALPDTDGDPGFALSIRHFDHDAITVNVRDPDSPIWGCSFRLSIQEVEDRE